ncbi:MAG: efflux RND transporter periplasmic adaptor subunit [Candidatus Omnitrophica bacterium]|nr:efflux RND transporter periplasmic adaptor subunit [Candidatus Omnitrophota bacterium]
MAKKIFFISLAVIIFMGGGTNTGTTPLVMAQEQEVDYYTCGMHPSVKILPEDYNEDVNCPICNMKLTAIYKEEQPGAEKIYYGCGVDTEGRCPYCDKGEPDSRCICGEHAFVIEGEKIDCPVCDKPLRELTRDEADKLKGVASRVKIRGRQAELAGVRTAPVRKLHLYKEIRTVGKVAYDPQLAIAQEEFLSALKSLKKIREGNISEIKERAERLLESSKRKLLLLGLSREQISELEKTEKVQTSFIMPEDKMWIYANVYEYELGWVKVGEKMKVTSSSLPGEEFEGIISSINPVLDPKTRSVTIRAEVDNPGLRLKPQMYVDVVLMSMYMSPEGEHMVLAIPKDAVLDTGMRKIVWIDNGSGEYEGRIVLIGPEATSEIDGKESKVYPVMRGLSEGELIVIKANFLIDSQSQITGVAAAAYGGALGAEEKAPAAQQLHQH